MSNKGNYRDLVRSGVGAIRTEAYGLYERLCQIPAEATTGEGYEATLEVVETELSKIGVRSTEITVPTEVLERHWGPDLAKSREYIPVVVRAPRKLIFARLGDADTDPPAVHLTGGYDVWRYAIQERAALATQLMALRVLTAAGFDFAGRLCFSATPDNHLGGDTGAGYLVEQNLGRAPIVVVGAMGGANAVTLGYKGKLWARLIVSGKAAHGSRPDDGVNAIDQMAIALNEIRRLDDRFRGVRSVWPIWPDSARRPTVAACRIEANHDGIEIPDRCVAYLDRRIMPEESIEAARQELISVIKGAPLHPECHAQLEFVRVVSNDVQDPTSPLVKTLQSNIRLVTGSEGRTIVWSNYSGFRLFKQVWGAEAVGYGAGKPDLQLGPVPVDSLAQSIEVLCLTILDLVDPDRDCQFSAAATATG